MAVGNEQLAAPWDEQILWNFASMIGIAAWLPGLQDKLAAGGSQPCAHQSRDDQSNEIFLPHAPC
jgi:hypothetical protein